MRPKFDKSSIFMRKVIITSVAKGLKLKVRRFLGLSSTFVEVTGKKLVGSGGFLLPPSLSHLEQGQCFVNVLLSCVINPLEHLDEAFL